MTDLATALQKTIDTAIRSTTRTIVKNVRQFAERPQVQKMDGPTALKLVAVIIEQAMDDVDINKIVCNDNPMG